MRGIHFKHRGLSEHLSPVAPPNTMSDSQNPNASGASAVRDLTGTTVGRFVVQERLGSGGMGEVYRAEDTKLKRSVALKRVAPRLRTNERYRRRLLREAERASRLNDSRIAGVYDVLEENGETFLVMEYVEGQNLRRRMEEGMDADGFGELAAQCAEALVAAHERDVVHGDIKPENIMLTPAGHVKILDFGVAKEVPRLPENDATASVDSLAGAISGTPAYMAPEALLEKAVDGRADIFSLGVVGYEALTGHHPFRAASFMATTDRILHESPPPPSQLNPLVPAQLDRIIGKMLAKDPAERYPSARALLADLRETEPATPALLAPVPAPLSKRRAMHFMPWVVLTAYLLVAAAVAWRILRPSPPIIRTHVAILPFANRTGNQRLDQFRMTLTQMLVLDLTGSPNIQVLPYERLLEITRGFEAEGKDLSSPEVIQAIATYTNSRVVVVPEVFALGNAFRVSAEFRDAQTGETLGATKVERTLSGSAEETVYGMEDQLAGEIRGYFRGLARRAPEGTRPEVSRPKNATAGLHYTEGMNALSRAKYTEALGSFQKVIEEDPEYAEAYARLGQIYGLLGYDDKGRALSEKAASLIRPQTPVVDAYYIQANLAERKYDYAAAEKEYLELIRLYPDDPATYLGLASVYENQAQYQKAISNYREAILHDSNYIVAYQQLGSLYGRTGDFAQALNYGKQALELYRAVANREGEASALAILAEISRLRGDFPKAKKDAQSALAGFQILQNEFGVIRATKVVGDVLFSQGDLEEARAYYQKVLSATGEIHNNRLVALTLMNMAVTYHREGDFPKAVEYYQRSLDQARLYGEYRERAQALTNLGAILIEYTPEQEKGFRDVQESLPIFQMMGDKSWEAQDRMQIGIYFMGAGRYREALDSLDQSLGRYQSAGNKVGMAQATYEAARCHFFSNRYEPALDSAEKALALAQEIPDPFRIAMCQILLGWTHCRLGNLEKARSFLEDGFRAAQGNGYGELLPDAYDALGDLDREQGDPQGARRSFQHGSELWKEPNVSESSIEARSNLGLLDAEGGDFGLAFARCQAAVAQARKLQHLHTLALTLINLAQSQLIQKQYRASIETLNELSAQAAQELGLELRAQAYFIQGRDWEGLRRSDTAKAAYKNARQAMGELRESLAAGHRESFDARSGVRTLAAWK